MYDFEELISKKIDLTVLLLVKQIELNEYYKYDLDESIINQTLQIDPLKKEIDEIKQKLIEIEREILKI